MDQVLHNLTCHVVILSLHYITTMDNSQLETKYLWGGMKGMKGEEMVKTNYGIKPRKKMSGKPNRIPNSILARLKKSEWTDWLKKPRADGHVLIDQTIGGWPNTAGATTKKDHTGDNRKRGRQRRKDQDTDVG